MRTRDATMQSVTYHTGLAVFSVETVGENALSDLIGGVPVTANEQ
jgi:hypothetical protein